ncbi:formyltetrahydrofolate deformylase [Vitreoscilla massiliensis]|uniref:Formyltetrahydrofolate deformylase n=1 Tax=Vitreoscilla massiliensis TaxID=1689272 RepID=A0ABY4E611_9NEIS|nr:formyltetrahydrofolate deformylase [Vitreoscilla massiliensis]UOO90914.1 formyltetrahydrofolate deformylase [Vitreoscilla massiliensis]
MSSEHTARLLIHCQDQAGIVQAVSGFLFHSGANITSLDQYTTEAVGGDYFMRVEFVLPQLPQQLDSLTDNFTRNVAERYQMNWRLSLVQERKKIALLVSKHDHALMELLWRHARGQLPCDIACVISNHEDLRHAVEHFDIPFHVVKVQADTKAAAEAQINEWVADCDVLVLARYMQILSAEFTEQWAMKIINIHHSFLPAFVGADPYRQAYEKGVKLIGATAHYVTADLDQGPIIEQDVKRVDHRYTVTELRQLGAEVERQVLARAVLWHVEDRIIVFGNKTVVFE